MRSCHISINGSSRDIYPEEGKTEEAYDGCLLVSEELSDTRALRVIRPVGQRHETGSEGRTRNNV